MRRNTIPIIMVLVTAACGHVELSEYDLNRATARACAGIEITGDNAADEDSIIAAIEATGRSFEVKQHATSATTLPDVVLLPKDWAERSAAGRVRLLDHEYTHACQQDTYEVQGEKKSAEAWVIRYGADAEFRLVAEVDAVTEATAAACRQGASIEQATAYAASRVDTFPRDYAIRITDTYATTVLVPRIVEAACPSAQ